MYLKIHVYFETNENNHDYSINDDIYYLPCD